MKDLFGNTVIEADEDEKITDILSRAGIQVVKVYVNMWAFQSAEKTVRAPKGDWQLYVEKRFGVKIVYK
jgi:hypothetical protein